MPATHLRSLFDQLPLVAFETDADGRVVFAGRHWSELTGLPITSALGDGWLEAVHPDDRDRAAAGWAEVVKKGQRVTMGYRILAVDGHVSDVAVEAAPLLDDEGVLIGWIGWLVDVTEQRRLEHEARRLDQRFRTLYAQSTDIITVLGADGSWQYSSPGGTRLLGYPPGHDPEGGIFSLIHPDDVALATEALAEVLDGRRGPDEAVVFRVRSADGEYLFFETVGQNLLDDPAIEGIVLHSRDVSERVRLQGELAFLAAHDPLTGLANRRLLNDLIEQALARTGRREATLAVLFIDLDGFKDVNDRLGHVAGDELLAEVASRLRSAVRAGDVVARHGGDEFVVLCEDVAGAAEAMGIAERIVSAVALGFDTAGGEVLGATVGVAVNRPGDTPRSLLMAADAALYDGKRSGGARTVLSSRPLS